MRNRSLVGLVQCSQLVGVPFGAAEEEEKEKESWLVGLFGGQEDEYLALQEDEYLLYLLLFVCSFVRSLQATRRRVGAELCSGIIISVHLFACLRLTIKK